MTATIEWSYNPWRERPARAWGALAALLLCCGLVVSTRLPLGVKLGLCAGAGASFGAAILPWRYRLDDDGVTSGRGPFAQRRPWSDIGRAVRSSEGILLSPFQRRHWLDPYRSLFLPLPPRASSHLAEDVDRLLSHHGL